MGTSLGSSRGVITDLAGADCLVRLRVRQSRLWSPASSEHLSVPPLMTVEVFLAEFTSGRNVLVIRFEVEPSSQFLPRWQRVIGVRLVSSRS